MTHASSDHKMLAWASKAGSTVLDIRGIGQQRQQHYGCAMFLRKASINGSSNVMAVLCVYE